METQLLFSSRRRLVLVLLVLGFVVSGAVELPLLPPVDVAQSSRAGLEPELRMSGLIRTFFGGQVKWSPFIRSDHVEHTPHHRIVHEHRHRHQNPDTEFTERRFHLRGTSQFQQLRVHKPTNLHNKIIRS